MTMRHLGPAARAARRAPVPSGHLGVDAGFVNEDEFLRVKMWLLGDPGVAPCGYVVTVLFAGVRRLFFSVMWCRRKNSWTVRWRVLAALASEFGQGDVGCLFEGAMTKSACASIRPERRSPPQGFAWVRPVRR